MNSRRAVVVLAGLEEVEAAAQRARRAGVGALVGRRSLVQLLAQVRGGERVAHLLNTNGEQPNTLALAFLFRLAESSGVSELMKWSPGL